MPEVRFAASDNAKITNGKKRESEKVFGQADYDFN